MKSDNLTSLMTPEELKNLYIDLVETSQDLIFQCDTQGRYVYLNPAWEEIFGYNIDEMIGKLFSDFQSSEYAKRDTKQFTQLLEKGVVKGFETVHLSKSGKEINLLFNAKNVLNKSGEIIGTRGIAFDITERKAAEELAHLTKFSLDKISDSVFWLDEFGNFKYVNSSACENLGYTMDELLTMSVFDIDQTFSKEMYQQAWDSIVKDVSLNVVTAHKTKNGTIIPVEVMTNFVEYGGVKYNCAIARDITDRKKLEQELTKSEATFRSLFEKGPIGVAYHKMIYDENGNYKDYYFIDANQSYLKLTGVDPRGKLVTEAFPGIENDASDWIGTFGVVAKTGKEIRFQQYLEANDQWYDVVGYQNEPDHFVAAFINITEQKRAEIALATEKERLTITLASIGDGVITTDAHGNITMLNRAAKDMTKWRIKEAYGKPLLDVFNIVNELSKEQSQNPALKVIETGEVIELANHTALIGKDGNEITIADSAAPIRDKQNKIIGVVIVFRDMTEKHRLDESRQKAQKLESLGLLAGGIAHDFNNLLSGMFGYVDMARYSLERGDNEKALTSLSKSFDVFNRTKALTQQLLTFAKGGAPIQKTINLITLIENSTRFALSGSKATAVIDLAKDLWLCDCDENQIGQVIDNLVINGQQAMPMGGEIDVSAVNEIYSGEKHVKISIKDHGIGISKEYINKIFDPFFTTKELGHGLGLATVYSIINRHGGSIDVQSELGKGTEFTIYIPASKNVTTELQCNLSGDHKGKGSVLIMDDEEFILETVGAQFENMGYNPIFAKDGKEAIDLFSKAYNSGDMFVVTLLDLTIPAGMGGADAIKEIRKIDKESVVIVASGYADDPIMMNPNEYGFTDKLAKPYRNSELQQLLEHHLKK